MIKGQSYKMLIDHSEHDIKEIYSNEKIAIFEVTVLDVNNKYFKFLTLEPFDIFPFEK